MIGYSGDPGILEHPVFLDMVIGIRPNFHPLGLIRFRDLRNCQKSFVVCCLFVKDFSTPEFVNTNYEYKNKEFNLFFKLYKSL